MKKLVASFIALSSAAFVNVASALPESVDTSIAAAQASGQTSTTAVVIGLIAIVAVAVGLGMVLSLLKKA